MRDLVPRMEKEKRKREEHSPLRASGGGDGGGTGGGGGTGASWGIGDGGTSDTYTNKATIVQIVAGSMEFRVPGEELSGRDAVGCGHPRAGVSGTD